jgi:hypothetical protein
VPEKFDHALDDPASAAIHAKEKNSKKCHRDDHNPGGHENLVPRRPSHLAHLDPNFVEKRAPPAGIFAELLEALSDGVSTPNAAPAASGSFILQLDYFNHKLFQILPKSLWPSPSAAEVAGEEGFEPPLSVLETDGLPLNLLPYLIYFTSL